MIDIDIALTVDKTENVYELLATASVPCFVYSSDDVFVNISTVVELHAMQTTPNGIDNYLSDTLDVLFRDVYTANAAIDDIKKQIAGLNTITIQPASDVEFYSNF